MTRETGVECGLTDVLHTRLMELDLDAPEHLPIPVVEFTGRASTELAGDEIEGHGEISNLDWLGADDLPSEVREYEQKVAHRRSLDRRRVKRAGRETAVRLDRERPRSSRVSRR